MRNVEKFALMCRLCVSVTMTMRGEWWGRGGGKDEGGVVRVGKMRGGMVGEGSRGG